MDFGAVHKFGESDDFGEVRDLPVFVGIVVRLELVAGEEAWIRVDVPLANPVFLVVSVMISKRYLKGGLMRSFSVILGLSMKPV